MDTIYFDENRGYVCAECAEDLGLENLPEASPEALNDGAECVVCAYTKNLLAKVRPRAEA